MQMRPNTRTRRQVAVNSSQAMYEVCASEHEIAKDLQLVYDCTFAQASQLVIPPAEPESKSTYRAKVVQTQRKRTFTARETEYLDSVLGFASLLTECETPGVEKRPKTSVVKTSEIEAKAKPKLQSKPQPTTKTKPKPTLQGTVQRKPPQQQGSVAMQHVPYGYPCVMGQYLFPYYDKTHPGIMGMQGVQMPPGSVYPPFGVMYQHGLYGGSGWPVPMPRQPITPPPAPVQSLTFKRAARHVAIAVFIRTEQKTAKAFS